MAGAVHAAVAAVLCPHCGVSDTATPFFVRDPNTGELVCTVLRCVVCGFLQLV
jgi:C4-type Zn-finger protein